MNFNDDDDFLFWPLLGAYTQSLRQEGGHQPLQNEMISVQQEGTCIRGSKGVGMIARRTKEAARVFLNIYYKRAPYRRC